MKKTKAILTLQDNTVIEASSFGSETPVSGELVFTTGMVGYPESITDPSYTGQLLVFTYPIIGNYGVPEPSSWESSRIHASAVIVSTYNDTPSHYSSTMTLAQWLKKESIPGIEVKDTRFLAQKLREGGSMLAKIEFEGKTTNMEDPNNRNLVKEVSIIKPEIIGEGEKTIILFDCGVKNNTVTSLVQRGVRVKRVPWDYDPYEAGDRFHGLFVSNGPGDPKMADKTIETIKKGLASKTPIFGICLGNQILALAAGGDTYKMKFGHRSQNQPCVLQGTERCYLTTQNHGFAVGTMPDGFKPWFVNNNDMTNEGIIHESLPFMSVQFHPEATPGPEDTFWLFDYFIEKLL